MSLLGHFPNADPYYSAVSFFHAPFLYSSRSSHVRVYDFFSCSLLLCFGHTAQRETSTSESIL